MAVGKGLRDRDTSSTETAKTEIPQTEIPQGRDMGPGSQTGSDIIQRPVLPVDRITKMNKNITLPQNNHASPPTGFMDPLQP